MKAALYDLKGNKKSDIELPQLFNSEIREDIAAKFFEVEKETQPYASYVEAGKRHVASGIISHRRHKWKAQYGKGISRMPRKIMWRRGTQFYWIGAEVSAARGGRRAHPPKGVKTPKKLNKKEITLAMNSAFAATANKNFVLGRYSSMKEISAPFVIESLPSKAGEILASLKKIFGETISLVLKDKNVRAGKGKIRGRKYKSNAGLLVVIGKDENAKFPGIEVRKVGEVMISDLYPLGRLTLYTKKALDELTSEEKKQ
ncbi:MAG: 50S ribosomal protein L4 [archaeon]|jgi:large subunit ribosomal protein L4e|nr:50S ribosomal protein L4 [archaeon]